MKLNYRIILINFSILALILTGAGTAFYSVLTNVLTTQESKRLKESANDLVSAFEAKNKSCDESFSEIKNDVMKSDSILNLSDEIKNLDFILHIKNIGSKKNFLLYKGSSISSPIKEYTIKDFFDQNQNLIVKSFKAKNGEEYLYGFNLDSELMSELQRLRIDFAFYFDNERRKISNEGVHQQYLNLLDESSRQLAQKSNYELYTNDSGGFFVLATIYHTNQSTSNSKSAHILIFTTVKEAGNLAGTLRWLIAIIAGASLILSIILNFLFTSKMRRQISSLTKATEIAKTGDLHNRIIVEDNDEIGNLGRAFNTMFNALEFQEKIKQDYTEFITQINESTDFKKIANDSLQRIIKSTNYSIGAIFLVNEEKIELVVTEGLDAHHAIFSDKNDLVYAVMNKNQKVELKFSKGSPSINVGFMEVQLAEVSLIPVANGDSVIAILQLAAIEPVSDESRQYLERIMVQLSIAMNKALVYKRLQELVVELEIQKRKAEESTEMKSKFLAMMSHELRTPLNSILGLAQLLSEDSTLSPRNRERLSVLMTSGKRLLQMINDVLDLSKIEAGKMDIKLEDFFLYELVKELQMSFNPMTAGKGIDLNVNYLLPEKLYIKADKTKIYQILNNLLSNAVKFTQHGYIEFTAQMIYENRVLFTIADTGVGIHEEDIPLIFNEFQQADNSSTRKYGGSGLGLAISKKFVEQLGGSIIVSSEAEKGSSFLVEIPVEKINFRNTEVSEEIISPKIVKSKIITGNIVDASDTKSVLIVDDDPESLFTMNEIVKECGYRTFIAKTGIECLEILNSVVPSLILMDLMMPDIDGFETTQNIRKNTLWAKIPIIAVSARSVLEEQKHLLSKGFDSVMPKPVNAVNLAFKITQLIFREK